MKNQAVSNPTRPQTERRIRRILGGPYDWPIVIFLLSAVIGLLWVYDFTSALHTIVVLLLGGLIYFILSRFATTHFRYSSQLWNIAASGLLTASALVGLYFFTQSGRLGYDDKVDFIIRIAQSISNRVPDLAIWKPLPNSVATFLEGSIFLTPALYSATRKRILQILVLLAGCLTGLGILFTASRGAWLAVFGAGLLWAAIRWKPIRILLFAGAAGLAVLIVFVLIKGDINAVNQIPVLNSILGPLFIRPDRLEVYRNSLNLLASMPFTGIGPGGQFAMSYSRYELYLTVPFLYYSHNLYIEVWLEQGLLGFTSWIVLIVLIYFNVWRRLKVSKDIKFNSTWAGLTAVFIHGLTDASQYRSLGSWLPFFILLGLNAALLTRQPLPSPAPLKKIRLAMAGGALLTTIFIINLPVIPMIQTNYASLLQQKADLSANFDTGQRLVMRSKAAAVYSSLLKFEPLDRTANQRLGLMALDVDNYTLAIQYLEIAHRMDPHQPATTKMLGLAYAFSGQIDRAVPLLQDIPNIINELNGWAWYLATTNRVTAGVNAYTMSLRLNPNQPDVKNLMLRFRPGN